MKSQNQTKYFNPSLQQREMKRLEKNFDVRIVIENKNLEHYACSGKFRVSDGIDALLHILQKDVRFKIEKDENTNTIYIK